MYTHGTRAAIVTIEIKIRSNLGEMELIANFIVRDYSKSEAVSFELLGIVVNLRRFLQFSLRLRIILR